MVIIACNAGHYNHYKENISWALSQKVSGAVIASDGTVRSSARDYYGIERYIDFTSHSGGSFRNHNSTNVWERDNIGWLIYNKKGSSPRLTGLKVLDAKDISSLYSREVWYIYNYK